ncbi:YbdK family carboxylate-amine ligase [Kitasatospora sp. NPDC006697]|uniref:carboxylate-amine ligase n=1 Tax=Kitasatospora sp. NPDC006697 TaxID=3364020 RepID=UPI0036B1E76B
MSRPPRTAPSRSQSAERGPGRLRFGVEEEYLLVDPATHRTVARAPEVLARAAVELGPRAQPEFLATQVEACTPPVDTPTQLRAELTAMRRSMARAAARCDCLLVASGTAVLPSRHPLPVTDSPRYRTIADRHGGLADGFGAELCGCHVHLGDLDRAVALRLSGLLRPWLPICQALSANSPFVEGRDHGFASSRSLVHRSWPTVGPAPLLDLDGYERTADALVADGPLVDRRMIYWYARPSEHLPTLEVRAFDVSTELETTVLLATLLRGLAWSLLADPEPAPEAPLLEAAHWQAARTGLRGAALDPVDGRRLPVDQQLHRLLARALPGLAAHGDLASARYLTQRLRARGTGADRQRAVRERRGSLHAVVAWLAADFRHELMS